MHECKSECAVLFLKRKKKKERKKSKKKANREGKYGENLATLLNCIRGRISNEVFIIEHFFLPLLTFRLNFAISKEKISINRND